MTKNKVIKQCERCGNEDSINAVSGLCASCESIVKGDDKCKSCGYPAAKGEPLCEDCKMRLSKQG